MKQDINLEQNRQEKEKSYFAQHEVKNHSDIWVDGNFSQELDTSTHFKLVNR